MKKEFNFSSGLWKTVTAVPQAVLGGVGALFLLSMEAAIFAGVEESSSMGRDSLNFAGEGIANLYNGPKEMIMSIFNPSADYEPAKITIDSLEGFRNFAEETGNIPSKIINRLSGNSPGA